MPRIPLALHPCYKSDGAKAGSAPLWSGIVAGVRGVRARRFMPGRFVLECAPFVSSTEIE